MVQYQEKQRQSTYHLYTHNRAEIAQMYLRCDAEVWVPTLYPPQSHSIIRLTVQRINNRVLGVKGLIILKLFGGSFVELKKTPHTNLRQKNSKT